MSEWISVRDRLPENEERVLAFGYWGGEYGTAIGTCDRKFGSWLVDTSIGTVAFPMITHWMPLPEPPMEDEA